MPRRTRKRTRARSKSESPSDQSSSESQRPPKKKAKHVCKFDYIYVAKILIKYTLNRVNIIANHKVL